MSVPHRYIVVEGAIGVGKTSLTRKLATTLGAQSVLEQADENPFLERFYRNPRVGALPAQLFFLFQRAQQQSQLKQAGSVRQRARGGLPAREGRPLRAHDAGRRGVRAVPAGV